MLRICPIPLRALGGFDSPPPHGGLPLWGNCCAVVQSALPPATRAPYRGCLSAAPRHFALRAAFGWLIPLTAVGGFVGGFVVAAKAFDNSILLSAPAHLWAGALLWRGVIGAVRCPHLSVSPTRGSGRSGSKGVMGVSAGRRSMSKSSALPKRLNRPPKTRTAAYSR